MVNIHLSFLLFYPDNILFKTATLINMNNHQLFVFTYNFLDTVHIFDKNLSFLGTYYIFISAVFSYHSIVTKNFKS